MMNNQYLTASMPFTAQENELMEEAICQARKAAKQGEVPVGAVLVDPQGEVVGRGRNQVITLSDPTAHAEIMALREAALAAGNYRLIGCTLFSTLEPCPMCLMAAIHARLKTVVFGAPEPRWGAAGSLLDMPSLDNLNHCLSIRGGLLADQARELMRSFFQSKRAEKSK